MDVCKKSVILGLTLLGFGVLVETMGICKFAKMFPNQGKKELIENKTLQEDKEIIKKEEISSNETSTTTEKNSVTTIRGKVLPKTTIGLGLHESSIRISSQVTTRYSWDNSTVVSTRVKVYSASSSTSTERAISRGTHCPSGYNKQLNNSCYKFVDSSTVVTRSAARSACKGDSSHLVYIETKEENDFLVGGAQNNAQYWIGIHERPNLFWDNGNQVTFANIDPDNFDTFDEETGCYRMSAQDERHWLDQSCILKTGYICEYEDTDCPSGYTKQLNDSCYTFVGSGTGATLSAARSACKGDSAHLVYIETKEENDFLVGEAESNTQYWIGIHERPNLFWDNGNQVTFANIDPDNYQTFYEDTGCYRMSVNNERYWLDGDCSQEHDSICEYESNGTSFYSFDVPDFRVNLSAARSACKGDSTHLVYIETKEENEYLVEEAETDTQYWIGIHERPNLFWDNGNQVTFANIDPDKSFTFNQDTRCYKMSANDERYWFDEDCLEKYGFICEYEGTDCPSGYIKQLHDSCYKFVDSVTGATRPAARSVCNGDSSHLVYIETKEENDFLVGGAQNNTQYWIGIHERPNLFWDNGNQVAFANIDPVNYKFLDAGTGCYRMSATYEKYWLENYCSRKYGYICEYED